jgi:putative FmdB family regulatory protein
MPIYEYRRPDGSTFEVLQSFSDQPLTHDPQTGVEVQRVLHAPALHFKGKGFYNTDYGTKKRQRESSNGDSSSADAAKPSSERAGRASESKSPETKRPESKAETKSAKTKDTKVLSSS